MPMLPFSLSSENLRELERVDARHLPRLGAFVLLLGVSVWGAVLLSREESSPWGWSARVVLYVLSAASLHGISLFTHEAVHGGLSSRPWLNRLGGMLCAWPVLQNFAAYKVLHLRHHRDLGGGLDPDHYANYTGRRWLELLMHVGRLLLGYPAYITMIPILGWKHGTASEKRWMGCEVAMVIAGCVLAGVFVPWQVLLHGWLIPMVIINTMVNIRGMSQHTFLADADHPVRGTRTILTNPVTRFFMCNENYHLEHHLYPRVPWYNLPALHGALRAELVSQGAPFIPSYASFVWGVVSGGLMREARRSRPADV
ncbi:fatty acid desaturase [Myxococcus stipitatus DSM 14675]|uniref:Fatty acid desaturase n=1 Tax=Myxococcus stipitatus (strain DSM 14675 / JCM 12634 / Mx s8) TaxID=1278073 RepID=L7ULM6_MYXSD|nr:fatty acid desaturase [Myxococcus stipitatus]AGC47379.1 fatty acid desaturase [Myxococcus stipitatus DSM 14675]